MAHKLIYVRTDKNGTKIYHDFTCQRCGGLGGADQWAYTGWTCYECGGSGEAHKAEVIKEYTPEYSAKLQAQREKRAEKRRLQRVAEFKQSLPEKIQEKGFNADGKLYVAVGDTYRIKDELREAGAKWKPMFNGWAFTEKPEAYNTVELTADECLIVNYEDGWLEWKEYKELLSLVQSKLPKEYKPASEYVGEVGERLTAEVTFNKVFSFERQAFRGWGTEWVHIYKFTDEDGNVYVWNTTAYADVEEGKSYSLTGTVAKHDDYKGEKQTELKRCKVTQRAS
jgi:hypothetical protein